MHPSAALHGTKSNKLDGKLIVLGVTGSIAAVESVKLARELIRHGATVQGVMSQAGTRILHPDALWFATGNRPIVELTGDTEHVRFCGEVEGKADLMLIAPATANTISKLAHGIDDTPVLSFATNAIGSGIPVLLVPAMHSSMYANPFVRASIELLESQKNAVELIDPVLAEGSAKFAETDEIVARVIRRLWKRDLFRKRVLVIAGATAEPVDEFRVITNQSTGRTGLELANCAFERGADVTLWYGASPNTPPKYIPTERFGSVDDLFSKMTFIDNDITIVCAAIADYTTDKHLGKIASGQDGLALNLKRTPKVLNAIREMDPQTYLVGFKAEYDVTEQVLIEEALDRLERSDLDMIVANDLKTVRADSNQVIILKRNRSRTAAPGTKAEIAAVIFDEIVNDLMKTSHHES